MTGKWNNSFRLAFPLVNLSSIIWKQQLDWKMTIWSRHAIVWMWITAMLMTIDWSIRHAIMWDKIWLKSMQWCKFEQLASWRSFDEASARWCKFDWLPCWWLMKLAAMNLRNYRVNDHLIKEIGLHWHKFEELPSWWSFD